MAVVRTYECPECSAQFSIRHEHSEDPPPSFCAACGSAMGEEPSQVYRLNYGGSNIARSADKVYRDLEDSSAARGEAAGDPSLKITDMQDNLREGDVAVKMPNNAVSQYAQQANHQFFQSSNIQGHLAAAKTGPAAASSGATAIQAIQEQRLGGNQFRKG